MYVIIPYFILLLNIVHNFSGIESVCTTDLIRPVFWQSFPDPTNRTAAEGGKMIENIFLTYANNKFYENVENLNVFFQAIISNIDGTTFHYNPKYIKYLIKSIADFSKIGPMKSVKKIEKKFPAQEREIPLCSPAYKDSEEGIRHAILIEAFNSVFGFRGNYIEYWESVDKGIFDDSAFDWWEFDSRECDDCKTHISDALPDIVFDKFNIQNDFQLQCFMCQQLQFIDLLTSLTEAKSLNSILSENNYKFKKLESLIKGGGAFLELDYEILDGQIKKKYVLNNDFTMGGMSFFNVVAYSFCEFLSNNDFKKLKSCPFCNKFYIADDIRQKRCKSDECRKKYEKEKKRKQRLSDPVKYY